MSAAFITWEFSRTTVHKRRLRKYLALALAHLSEKLKRYKELCGLIQKPLKKMPKRESPGQGNRKHIKISLTRENIRNVSYLTVY